MSFSIVSLFDIALVVGIAGSAVCYLIGMYSAWEFFRRPAPAPKRGGAWVTVLRPLKGLDIGLYDNLKSLCRQNYDRFQLVFGVADPHDPAAGIVRRLQREFPNLDIELVVDDRVYGSNYKVSNLHNMLPRAKHGLIVLADSDIRVGPDYLGRLVAELDDPSAGLVTCVYRAVNAGGFPTRAETLFINTDFASMIMLARKVETATYAFGATIAMRREVLDEIGGFLPLVDYLADDYQLGYRVAERGYRLALSREVVSTVIALGSWRKLYDHQLRWARTYRICRPGGYFGSILTHGTLWAFLTVLIHGFGPVSSAVALGLVTLRLLSAAQISWPCLRTQASWIDLLLVVPKDLFVSAIWFLAFASNQVTWSGRRFEVARNGEMIDLSGLPRAQASPDAEVVEQRRAGGQG
jgi:ceramide glucosyltransferase